MKCPKCSSENIKSEGNRSLYSKSITFDFFECGDCGMQFAENPDSQQEESTRSLPSKEELIEKIRQKHKKEDERQEKIENLLNGNPFQPPPLFNALNNLKNKNNPSSEEIADLLGKFPFLGERLLELINGPCFFDQDTFQNFRDLLENWPLEAVAQMVLALEIVDLIQTPESFLVSKNAFWTHGIVSGLAAKSIANFLGEENNQKYFLAGLVLNIGRLILANHFPDATFKAVTLCKNSGSSLFEAEEKVFDFTHAQIGGNLLRKWGFENAITEGVIYHHRPNDLKNPSQSVYILHLSEAIAHDLKLGSSGEKHFPRPDSLAVQSLGLTRSLLENIKGNVTSLTDEAKRLIIA
ncbi:MAG: HDOD domain-containing protein [Candidatus Nitronauta litoralis]|uniref:HDOD domain-containing protein n=1 Tax=Candidatus Nitronauta litoralis TaxID=2705533 RepID=A0A7T0G204_9BACT|nr:MAG: HDOD domain-containing protein [Candidatus Nitronauta litoralis]